MPGFGKSGISRIFARRPSADIWSRLLLVRDTDPCTPSSHGDHMSGGRPDVGPASTLSVATPPIAPARVRVDGVAFHVWPSNMLVPITAATAPMPATQT